MKPICLNHTHEVIITTYLDTIFDSINEVVQDTNKYKDFKEIANIIIDYHNQYSNDKHRGNFHDFLMIIPVNFSTMVSGFLCGLENKDNAAVVRIHRHLLYNLGLKVIEDLTVLKTIND